MIMRDKKNQEKNSTDNAGSSLQITEAMIKNLVDNFYSKVREDTLIGPLFQNIIKDKSLMTGVTFYSEKLTKQEL